MGRSIPPLLLSLVTMTKVTNAILAHVCWMFHFIGYEFHLFSESCIGNEWWSQEGCPACCECQ